jgi:hypothetical protein
MRMLLLLLIGFLNLSVNAVPPPLSGPPNLISGRYEVKFGFYDTNFVNNEECLGVAWQDLENGVLREDDNCFYLDYPYDQTAMFHIFYQRVINGVTRSWYAIEVEDGSWQCFEIVSPFPKPDYLKTNCTYAGEDLVGVQEAWKYNCVLNGPSGLVNSVIWIKQDPNTAFIILNTQEPSPPYPNQVIPYLNFAPLPPNLNLSRYVPPAIAGCNIPLEWSTFPPTPAPSGSCYNHSQYIHNYNYDEDDDDDEHHHHHHEHRRHHREL